MNRLSIEEVLGRLRAAGLGSIPGGALRFWLIEYVMV